MDAKKRGKNDVGNVVEALAHHRVIRDCYCVRPDAVQVLKDIYAETDKKLCEVIVQDNLKRNIRAKKKNSDKGRVHKK